MTLVLIAAAMLGGWGATIYLVGKALPRISPGPDADEVGDFCKLVGTLLLLACAVILIGLMVYCGAQP